MAQAEGRGRGQTHSPSPDLLLPRRHLPQPPPTRQPPARRVEEVEVIAVPDARHLAQQAPPPEIPRRDVGRAGQPAQVRAVELVQPQGGHDGDGGRDPVARLGVVRPVRGVEGVVPRHGARLLWRRRRRYWFGGRWRRGCWGSGCWAWCTRRRAAATCAALRRLGRRVGPETPWHRDCDADVVTWCW